ncbi:YncE family protein [Pararobbsia silviterrae]|uniref:YncE family protein n=1 Tax=Pararobbsia silviterrae TaxID=1792498 RepID=A0A494Y4Q2_9BURK|nr:YncE family protein [Pararobbsia silviterrae]RKP57699.1 YncE family protein [Pararobbsia silviterrae]
MGVRSWKSAVALLAFPVSMMAVAGTTMLSANDGIETFSDGAYHVLPGASEGSLSALDISTMPPRLLWTVPSEQTAAGPPSAVAVTPDGKLALVSNAAIRDPAAPTRRLDEKALLVYDLSQAVPKLIETLPLERRPWGIAIDPSGRHALAADGDGTVTWLTIQGTQVRVAEVVSLGPPSLKTMATAFTKDGRWALVTRRGDAGVTALRIDGDKIEPVRDITVGSNPYMVIVSPDGRYAAVSDIGHVTGDRNSVTLIDLRSVPFRAVDVFSVASTPEAIAFSPDSKRLAVDSINGSNMKHDDPSSSAHSLIQLFDVSARPVRQLGATEVGANAQGVAFAPDGASLIVQDFASNSLLVFGASEAGLSPLKYQVAMPGAPSALTVLDSQ